MPKAPAMHTIAPTAPARQHGAALIVALLFLVVMTLVGVAAMDSGTIQSRMNINYEDSSIAFQSADSAVAYGEAWLRTRKIQPVPDCSTEADCWNSKSVWPMTQTVVTVDNMMTADFWESHGRKYGWAYEDGQAVAAQPNYELSGSADDARFLIAEVGKDPSGSLVVGQGKNYEIWYYQVSARGIGSSEGTQVYTQSVYGKGF